MSADLLTDGFLLLQRMPIAEIEKRIAWLEDALASYRTLLVVRRVMLNKPSLMEVPKEWETSDPIIPSPVATPPKPDPVPEAPVLTVVPSENQKPLKRNSVAEEVDSFMRLCPSGAATGEICEAIQRSKVPVLEALRDATRYRRVGWKYFHVDADKPVNVTREQQREIADRDLEDEEKYVV